MPRSLLLAPLFLACTSTGLDHDPDGEGFVPLFNGRDLSGWTAVNTAPDTWTVQDGLLHCTGVPTGQLRTERMYQNFVLELEWRHLEPAGNAGVFVWSDDITARGVPFQRGIEIQVLDHAYGNTNSHTTHGDIFPIHGAQMTPINGRGGSRAFPTELRSNPSPQWNHYRISCLDGAIELQVNGATVTRGEAASPRKGYICLESEGGQVDYRGLRIKELPDTPLGSSQVAIVDRGYRSLYTGVDLTGWSGDAERWSARDWILHHQSSGDTPDLLVTDELFGDLGFVVDVRVGERGGARILVRGAPETALEIDRLNGLIGRALRGGWNRLEGRLAGNRLSLLVNGEAVLIDQVLSNAPERGPFALEAAGPVDFASLFVRELEDPRSGGH